MGELNDMNPQISASEKDFYGVSSVSLSFRLEWKIPKKAFTDRKYYVIRPTPHGFVSPENRNATVIENSKVFDYENLEQHPFYLSLLREKEFGDDLISLRLIPITRKGGPVLDYAMVCQDGRLYSLSYSDTFIPPYLRNRNIRFSHIYTSKVEDISIICGIRASCSSKVSSEEIDNGPGDSDRLRLVCSLPQDYLPPDSYRMWSTSVSLTGKEALAKHSLTGELPTLNVELAKDLLEISSKEDNPVLKALCVEYLMENLSAENVIGVMRQACNYHAKDLVTKCYDFVSKDCRVTAL